MKTTATSRKVLVPLATLVAAGAVAIGSGATWTSTTDTSIDVTGGNLLHTNDRNNVTLNLHALKPGDTMSGTLTIKNTGDVDSYLQVIETASTNTFGFDEGAGDPLVERDLKLTIKAAGMTAPIYDGSFGDWANGEVKYVLDAAGPGKNTLTAPVAEPAAVGESVSITFTVELIDTADNDSQAATASASYDFVTVPVEGVEGLAGVWSNLTALVSPADESTDGDDTP